MPAGIMPSWPRVQLLVAFQHGADASVLANGSASVGWVDLGPRLRGEWSAEQSGRQYELDQIQSGSLTCTLDNQDRLLDPTNTASPLYPAVRPMRPCRLVATWPPTQNLFRDNPSIGNSTRWITTAGTPGITTGLAVDPGGHSSANTWTVPAGTASGAQYTYGAAPIGSPDRFAQNVVPGRTYTISTYLSRPAAGGDATVQAQIGMAWYGYNEAATTSVVSSSVAVPRQSSWQRVTFTVTAPAGVPFGRPFVRTASNAVAANTIYSTSWQVEEGSVVTAWAHPGTEQALWAGFVERWPMTWDYSGTMDLLQITCIDPLAVLSAQTLEPSLRATLTTYSPTMMYPLDEPQGSRSFNDAAGRNRPAVAVDAPAGPGTINAGTGIDGSGSIGNPGPVLNLTNPNVGIGLDEPGSFLVLPSLGPPTSTAWTRILCFRTTSLPPSGGAATLWSALGPAAFGGSGSKARAVMDVAPDGRCAISVYNAAGLGGSFGFGPSIADGNWHLLTLGMSADGLFCRFSIDGATFGASLSQDSRPLGCTSDLIGVTATYPTGGRIWYSSADFAYAAEVPVLLDDYQLFDMGRGFAQGWAGESARDRAIRINSLAGYKGPFTTGAATAAVGTFPASGSDAMSALQLVADSGNGQVVVDQFGTLVLYGRGWRYMQPANPIATFGEDAASGEVPYGGDFALDFDPTLIYNVVGVTNSGAGGTNNSTSVSTVDLPSQAEYTPRTTSRTTNLYSDAVAADLAAGLLYDHKAPSVRVSNIAVDVGANAALFPKLTPLFFGSRVRVKRRPKTGAAISLDGWLEHVSWSGDGATGRLQWRGQISPAPDPTTPWAVATSLHTTLAASASVGATSITVGALPGAALNKASSVLPVGTQLSVGYGTATAQTVTVTAVGATSPGYSTVALTVTPALTVAHSAGEVVAQPPVGSIPTSSVLDLDPAGTITATGPLVTY